MARLSLLFAATVMAAFSTPALGQGNCLDLIGRDAPENLLGTVAYPLTVGISPDDAHVYVGVRGDFSDRVPASLGALVVYTRDRDTGRLSYAGQVRYSHDESKGLTSVYDITFSPDGAHAYVADDGALSGPDEGSISVFTRDPITGHLTFLELWDEARSGSLVLQSPSRIEMSRDGRHVYVSSGSSRSYEGELSVPDGIAVFTRDQATGRLTLVQAILDGQGGVTGMDRLNTIRLSPDGRHLYTSAASTGQIATFSRDADTGTLTFLGAIGTGTVDGRFVALSPTGDVLYAGGASLSGRYLLASFRRNTDTGLLQPVASEIESPGDSSGFIAAEVTPDGRALYVADYGGAVRVFALDPDTGTFALARQVTESETRFGLSNAIDIALTSDGRHAYVPTLSSRRLVAIDTRLERPSCEGSFADPERPCSPAIPFRPGVPGFRLCALGEPGIGGRWYDPTYAFGYEYHAAPGATRFASVQLPHVGDGRYELYRFDPTSDSFVFDRILAAFEHHDFPSGGIDRFRVLGIETSAVNPGDPLGFRTKLDLVDNETGHDFAMIPLVRCPGVGGVELQHAFGLGVAEFNAKNGPGGDDDGVKLVKMRFGSAVAPNPTTSNVTITLVDRVANRDIFSARLAAESGFWTRPNPTKAAWKYRDPGKPTATGIKTAVLKETPKASGIYELKMAGVDASVALPNGLTSVQALVQVDGAPAVCVEVVARCRTKNTKTTCHSS